MMFRCTLQKAMEEMKSGVYDFTKDGECSNCGECCSNYLPVSQKEIEAIRRFIQNKKIREQRLMLPLSGRLLDLTCPFRDNSEKKCAIYPVRPAICRNFRCDKPRKQIMADKWMYHEKHSIVDMRKEFFGDSRAAISGKQDKNIKTP